MIGLVNPLPRNELPIADAAAVQVELAELDHLARRHQHLVAAEVDALWILRPLRKTETERSGQLLLRELPRAFLRRLGEDRRQQVRRPGAVLDARAGLVDKWAPQHEANPVRALHPRAIAPPARRLQTRSHRQKIFDRDLALLRFRVAGELRKVVDDLLIDAL